LHGPKLQRELFFRAASRKYNLISHINKIELKEELTIYQEIISKEGLIALREFRCALDQGNKQPKAYHLFS